MSDILKRFCSKYISLIMPNERFHPEHNTITWRKITFTVIDVISLFLMLNIYAVPKLAAGIYGMGFDNIGIVLSKVFLLDMAPWLKDFFNGIYIFYPHNSVLTILLCAVTIIALVVLAILRISSYWRPFEREYLKKTVRLLYTPIYFACAFYAAFGITGFTVFCYHPPFLSYIAVYLYLPLLVFVCCTVKRKTMVDSFVVTATYSMLRNSLTKVEEHDRVYNLLSYFFCGRGNYRSFAIPSKTMLCFLIILGATVVLTVFMIRKASTAIYYRYSVVLFVYLVLSDLYSLLYSFVRVYHFVWLVLLAFVVVRLVIDKRKTKTC